MPNASEEVELLRRCQAGSEEAFHELVQRYQRRTYWIAYHFLQDYELAQDISQEAFLRVYQSLKRFDFSKNFYTWFYRIVVNLCVDYLRRKKGIRENSLNGVEAAVSYQRHLGKGETAPKEDIKEQVYAVLALLPTRYREILILRDIQGLSIEEISEIIDIPQATLRWRIHQARKRFRFLWNENVKTPVQEERES